MAAPVRRSVYVLGVGMTKFVKPSSPNAQDYPEMAKEACEAALTDAGLSYDQIQQAVVGYVFGNSTCGQRAVYGLGLTGIPVYNVNNNCSTGATVLHLAKQLVEGSCDCVLALGFEKMQGSSITFPYNDRANPLEKHVEILHESHGLESAPVAPQMFAAAAREYMKKYGTKPEVFGKIAVKNHLHSANNPYSQMTEKYTLDEIMNSKMIQFPLTRLQCCPTSNGSAAAILCSEDFVKKLNAQSKAVKIVGMEMKTDQRSSFEDGTCINMVGYGMAKTAADTLYKKTGIKPSDVDVVELHDCFSANELLTYEALGLCNEGEAAQLVESGNNTYGGKYVVNPSGGLISKGHPLGASGVAQCVELCWQLRNRAGSRQVPHAKTALQHNIGLGGAVVVALYQRGFPQEQQQFAFQPTSGNTLKSDRVFKMMKENVNQNGEGLVKQVKGIFAFKIKDGSSVRKMWLLNLKSGSGSLNEVKEVTKADCTVTMADGDFLNLLSGKLSPQMAFMSGKLKISGNMAMAMKLQQIIPKGGHKSKL